jgi:hypothetical protein
MTDVEPAAPSATDATGAAEREAEAAPEGHIEGNRSLPDLVDGWARYPSVVQRYYTTYKTSNHQAVHVHSNSICVLGVDAGHPMLAPPLRVVSVAYRSHDSKSLLGTDPSTVRGKKKAGAVFVNPRDMVCTVGVSDGSEVVLYACMRGSVVEINHRLIERPELLGTPEGYVAVIMPKIGEKRSIAQAMLDFDRETPLDTLSANAKRKLEGKQVRTNNNKRRKPDKKPCFEFQRAGACKFGDGCRFAHADPAAAATAEGGAPSTASAAAPTAEEEGATALGMDATAMDAQPSAEREREPEGGAVVAAEAAV